MRRYLVIFTILFTSFSAKAIDSTQFNALNAKLEEYFYALKTEPTEIQKSETDFIIETCTDSLVQQFTATKAYNFFRESKIMGSEATAIHIFDKWFATKLIVPKEEYQLFEWRLHAELNRPTLIGNVAPEITTDSLTIIPSKHKGYKIIFFYDDKCAKCKIESIKLRELLKKTDPSVVLYKIHAFDTKDCSNFTETYGLIQTPRIFLLDPNDIIIGRELDVDALEVLLSNIFKEIEYASEQSIAFYKSLFNSYGKELRPEDIINTAQYIQTSTAKDRNLQKQMLGDLLYFLSNQKGEVYKAGGETFAHTVLSQDLWTSSNDSLQVLSLAQFMVDLYSKSKVGEKIDNIKLPATVIKKGKSRNKNIKLARLRCEKNYIIFYSPTCNSCKSEISAGSKLAQNNNNTQLTLVNVDEINSKNPNLSKELFDAFDLSSLPLIIETDRKSLVKRKYFSFCE